ncbi:MAG: CBS domain-containing protein [Candidatus Omnitrophota bacterium]|nr:MAG: CBS domain-containing protein [Candidatus Omnitrophota bacterium]
MKVKDIMTKDVITVNPSMDLHQLAKLLIGENISGAPVVNDEGKFLGVVLEEGLIFQDKKVHLPTVITLSMGFLTLGMHKFKEEIKKIAATKVEDIMEKDVVTFSADTSVEDVATIMVEKKVYYCPVVEEGKVVGVITKKDIVRTIVRGDIW